MMNYEFFKKITLSAAALTICLLIPVTTLPTPPARPDNSIPETTSEEENTPAINPQDDSSPIPEKRH